jgi:hypothetical protein
MQGDGFELLENYVEDPKALIKKTRAKLKKIPTTPLEDHQIRRSLTPVFEDMVEKLSVSSLLQPLPTFELDQ